MTHQLSLAESVLLLLLDGRSGRPITDRDTRDRAASGGALLALVLARRVRFDSYGLTRPADRTLAVVNRASTGNPATDDALARLQRRPMTVRQAVIALAPPCGRISLEHLVHRGIVRPERSRVLGLVPRTTYRCEGGTTTANLRSRLKDLVRNSNPPDEALVALTALLRAVDLAEIVLGTWDRVDEARAQEIGEGYWRPRGISREVDAVTAAVSAAVATRAATALANTQAW